jgi:cation:H+ antiporter
VTFFHEIHFLKWAVALGLLGSYAVYLKMTVSDTCGEIEHVEPLYLSRFFRAPTTVPWISVQLVASLGLIICGAHLFIRYVELLSHALGASPLILSLIITPVATELPEKLNSVIWIGRKKDTLALGNITGAMVFQSCFPVVFGILFTEWDLRGITMVSAACALSMALITLLWIRWRGTLNPFVLLLGGLFYLYFIIRIFM